MFSFCSLLYCLLFKCLYSYFLYQILYLLRHLCTVYILLFNVSFAQIALCNVQLPTGFILTHRWKNVGLMERERETETERGIEGGHTRARACVRVHVVKSTAELNKSHISSGLRRPSHHVAWCPCMYWYDAVVEQGCICTSQAVRQRIWIQKLLTSIYIWNALTVKLMWSQKQLHIKGRTYPWL
jgi:hypothetical protein